MASLLDERCTKAEVPALLTPDATSRRTRTSKPFLAILTLLSLNAAFYLYRNGIPFYQTPISSLSYDDDTEWPLPKIPDLDLPGQDDDPFQPLRRYSLDYGKVACWQDNGVWIKRLTPVEMSALGIDRFHDSDRALEQADEDAFCTRLRKYGASFWELPPRWPYPVNWCQNMDACVKPTKEVRVEVGFPASGGVWVLDTSQGWVGLYPKSAGLRNSLTMDERCEVLKNLGGRFCEDIQVCPELDALLEPLEGMQRLGDD
jgi:hypothetical protein